MTKFKYYISIIAIFAFKTTFSQTATAVNHFSKVIISPHIEVTFVEGNEESVTIEKSTVSNDKINVEVNDNTLRIYLDGEKDIPKNETVYENGHKEKHDLYNGTAVTATVSYKTMNNLSIRGEETHVCKSLLKGDQFKLKIYGESQVTFNEVDLGELQTTIYGESSFEIKSGSIKEQRYTSYGESKINSLAINNTITKITSYGESDFRINASGSIKITAYGDAKLQYKGTPEIIKGLNIGDVEIAKID